MAAGQAAFTGSWDVAACWAVEERLERRGVDVGRVHAALLRDVLELHTLHVSAGMSLMSESEVARLLRVSEWKAGRRSGRESGRAAARVVRAPSQRVESRAGTDSLPGCDPEEKREGEEQQRPRRHEHRQQQAVDRDEGAQQSHPTT